jgi:hypothetical protein
MGKPFILPKNKAVSKRFPGEILGVYELVKLAGEGPHADFRYWKSKCLRCGTILTININKLRDLRQSKDCIHCRYNKNLPQVSLV